ncbi:MAG: hypothetical protein ACYS7Y_11695 [Planctomycetota bacterium]|jgi:hypothetical protein
MKLLEKIEDLYWTIIPYECRPMRVWYRLKCFFWHRYSTIKPRYMGHTWANRDDLTAHAMFEILSQFIEKECTPEIVEWYGEYGRKVLVMVPGGPHRLRYVRDEMQDLYDWWHQVYIKDYQEVSDILWEEAHKHAPKWENFLNPECKSHFDSEEDNLIWDCCFGALNRLDETMIKELQSRLHRLVNIRIYLST